MNKPAMNTLEYPEIIRRLADLALSESGKALTALAASVKRELRINLETMANYDFLFSKAKLANDMHAVCPSMSVRKKTVIVNGRHPLIGAEAVPLNFHIGDGYRALVITGPNTGCKTVVLKTVGLFTLMAQAGLHIPADEGTELAVYDDVLADIGDDNARHHPIKWVTVYMSPQ